MLRDHLSKPNIGSRRGQAYVAEALFAVVLLAGVMLVVTSTLAIDEPALSGEEREDQAELEAEFDNVIEQSKQEGSIKSSILNWDEGEQEYVASNPDEEYYFQFPPGVFGSRLQWLEQTYNESGRNVNIHVKIIPSENGSDTGSPEFGNQRPESQPFVEYEDAANTMFTVDTHVTLYGDDQFRLPRRAHRTEPTQSTVSDTTTKLADLEDGDAFPIPPASGYDDVDEDDVYNVVNVRVIAWEK